MDEWKEEYFKVKVELERLKAEMKVYQEADNLEISSFKVENEKLRKVLEDEQDRCQLGLSLIKEALKEVQND